MSDITIVTNGHERALLSVADLSEREASDFDYITGEDRHSPRIVRYRGELYDLSEFQAVEPRMRPADCPLAAWSAYQSDSYFSGVVIRWAGDFETVVVGRYYS